jgi:hypothetical protein
MQRDPDFDAVADEALPAVFAMDSVDREAVALATKMAHRLLTVKGITPRQIHAVARALYALDRLPRVTSGCLVRIGVCHRSGGEGFSEMQYLDIAISEEEFGILQGGSVYDSSVGSDTISGPEWRVEQEGGRMRSCSLREQANRFDELIGMGGTVEIEDESDFEIGYE